jgi:hypothetical protein
MLDTNCLFLILSLTSLGYVIVTMIKFGTRIHENGIPPEKAQINRIAVRIGLASLVTGFFGSLYTGSVNGSSPSIGAVVSCSLLWPVLVLALFFYAVFAPRMFRK